jgi:sigma-B regulation protein RsbU (phosphoserine phosphatase)
VVQSPHITLGNLNRILVENSLEEQYMTAFCGILSPAEGGLHFANAGHVPPWWWHGRNRTIETLRDAVGLPLGIDPRAHYHHKRVTIEPGDVLCLVSDGVPAAVNEAGEMFGERRLEAAIIESGAHGAGAVKSAVLARLGEFLHGAPPQDDVTLLVFERAG